MGLVLRLGGNGMEDRLEKRPEKKVKPIRMKPQQKPEDRSAGFKVTQGVFKRESSQTRGGGC